MKQLRLAWILLAATLQFIPMSAQTIVKGHVVNERGEAVEYVSIGIQNDSIGCISDAQGHFALEIPKGKDGDLIFTHVSYQTATLSRETYGKSGEVTVTLKDKVVELAEVIVGKNSKPKTIAGKGIPTGPVVIKGQGKMDGWRFGPIFKNDKDYVVSDILLTVKHSSFQWCVLRFDIFEVVGDTFTNILNKPLYQRVEKTDGKLHLDARPDETILLSEGKQYLVSVAMVDSDGYGSISLQSQLKNGCVYSVDNRKRRLPASPAIVVKGYEVEK